MSNILCANNGYPGEELPFVFAAVVILFILLLTIGVIITKRAVKQFSSMNYASVLRLKKALLYFTKGLKSYGESI